MRLLLIIIVLITPFFGRMVEETLSFPQTAEVEYQEGEAFFLPFKLSSAEVNIEAERDMLELVNKERQSAGLESLKLDNSLTLVAREHSRDMWERQYFAHKNPDGETPFDRMEEEGVEFRLAGENLALAKSVKRAHTGLMNSEGHRKNILDPNFTRIGIGVIDGGIYGKMFTQDFAD